MKAVILAGGRGERLRPLTDEVPKPMVRVADKPVLEHVINLFKKHAVTEFVLTLYHRPDTITDYFGDGKQFGAHIEYTFEDKDRPMGTAGGVLNAHKFIDDTFIVASGDILREIDIEDMINHHKRANAFATLNVYKRMGSNPKSVVTFGSDHVITDFHERPNPEDISDNFVWSNGSFYIFEPGIFGFIPRGGPSDFGKDIFPTLLSQGKRLIAYSSEGYFVDIGDPEKLRHARSTFRES